MEQRRLLAFVSAAQLATAAMGMVVALRRGHSFDVGFMRGEPEDVARDSILNGTALSAPVTMLTTQAVATAVLVRKPSRAAAIVIGVLGAANLPGYLSEQLVRQRLSRSGWDALESPLLIGAMFLSAAMPLLAWQGGEGAPVTGREFFTAEKRERSTRS